MTANQRRTAVRTILPAIAFTALSSPTWAVEPITAREVVFEKAGEHWWERPKDVRFVRIQICGGGGGGGGGLVFWPWVSESGGGGAGSEVHDVFVGPLDAARYQIVIGNGGKGGATFARNGHGDGKGEGGDRGQETSFKGDDASFVAAGGDGGDAPEGKTISVPGSGWAGVPVHAIRVGTFRQPHGGGMSESGGASPYAVGGKSEKSPAGGGGAGLKQGGDGGVMNANGSAGGACSGGGGAGRHSAANVKTTGGAGGPGFLMLVPLVSSDAVEARVRKLLETFEGAKNP